MASTLDDDGAAIAAAILFSLPGIPSIYQGDEQAFRGMKGEGASSDDQIRPPLPASPEELSEFGWWMYRHYQELVAARRRHPWLVDARVEVLDKANERLSYRVTSRPGNAGCPGNLGEGSLTVTIDLTAPSITLAFDDGDTVTYAG
ncbi:hypothetical protein [Trueperella sp. HMSC08B05]|uniref:hypothetical protein n=1 Tax=Trueperella sp. HMSC08B05 TaxID=1581135 RepID=UPI00352F7F0A